MTKEQLDLKKILEVVVNMQKTLDRHIKDYHDDREMDADKFRDLNAFANIGREIEFSMKNVERIIAKGYKDVTEAVEDAGEELGEHVQKVKATIDKKEAIKTFVVKQPVSLNFLKKFFKLRK